MTLLAFLRPDVQEQPRPRRDRLPIPRSSELVGFAPVPPEQRVCLSTSGRWRAAHVWDKDSRCVFCPRVLMVEG